MRLTQSNTGGMPKWFRAPKWIVGPVLGMGLFATCGSALFADVRPEVGQLLRDGHQAFREGRLDDASSKFSEALLLDPTADEAVDFIEDVNWAQVIEMMRAENKDLTAAVGAIERLASTAVRDQSRNPIAIAAKIDQYFSTSAMTEQQKLRFSMVNEHGVYIMPGLVERLSTNEAGPRTRAILAIRTLGVAATPALNTALGHKDSRVVASIISAINAIGAAGTVPSLAHLAETHPDSSIREASRKTVENLDPTASSKSAFDLLLAQAHDYYMDRSALRVGDTESIVWTIDDGSLIYRDEPSWVINELRAQPLLRRAIGIEDAETERAYELAACNDISQWVDYVGAMDLARAAIDRGEGDESVLQELEGQRAKYARIRNRAYTLAPTTLLGALDGALSDDKPSVAVELLESLSRRTVAGTRVDSVPAVIETALQYRDRGVRFGAAELAAKMNPRGSFRSSERVISHLTEGLVEAGGRVALTIIDGDEDARKVAALLRGSNVATFNETDGVLGLQRALSYPHDLIVLEPSTNSLTTEEIITRLVKDYRTTSTPIYLFTEGDVTALEQRFQQARVEGITVLPLTVSKETLRDQYLRPMFESKADARARSAKVAARAAQALEYLATRDTDYDLTPAYDGLIAVLENRANDVRIPACRAIAALDIDGAQPALLDVLGEEGRPSDLTIAALEAIGSINSDRGQVDEEVVRALDAAADSEDIAISTVAHQARGEIGLAPAVHRD